MTLSAVIALILRFFTEFARFSGRLYHSGWSQTYNVHNILPPSSSLLLLGKTITHPAARSLCDSWTSCSVLFEVANVCVNRKPTCDFLLLNNTNSLIIKLCLDITGLSYIDAPPPLKFQWRNVCHFTAKTDTMIEVTCMFLVSKSKFIRV